MEEIIFRQPYFKYTKKQKSDILKVLTKNKDPLCMTNEIRKLLNIKDPNIHFSPDSVQEQDDIVQALNRELNRYRIQWMNQIKHHDRRLYNKRKRY